jgi:isopentenyl diphosphate isomerase/L-lactate dehydrogenase-like FMN-dependent dehydrogenase
MPYLQVVAAVRSVNARRVAAGQAAVEVMVDGGVRRGRDAFTAIALGASAVLVGRPLLWGLAAAGQQGVQAVLNLLTQELRTCMQVTSP